MDAKLSGPRFQSTHIPCYWYLFAGTNRSQKLSPARICHKKLSPVSILTLKVISRSYETRFLLPNRHGRYFSATSPRDITFVDAKLSGSRLPITHMPCYWYLFAGTSSPKVICRAHLSQKVISREHFDTKSYPP